MGVQWLAVKDTDDDKTRVRKKKLQKSFKSKMRFQQLDMEVKNRQSNWLNFKKGKGSKKKVHSTARILKNSLPSASGTASIVSASAAPKHVVPIQPFGKPLAEPERPMQDCNSDRWVLWHSLNDMCLPMNGTLMQASGNDSKSGPCQQRPCAGDWLERSVMSAA